MRNTEGGNMRINDFQNIIEVIKQDVLQSEEEYLKLLRVVGKNQRYNFVNQLSIYDRNPNATACAKFDYWKQELNRVVQRGTKRHSDFRGLRHISKSGSCF